MINFDLSLPDDDEWLDNLETEDDYKDREEYDRSMTPPSPSLLDIEDLIQEEDDIHNESEGRYKHHLKSKFSLEMNFRLNLPFQHSTPMALLKNSMMSSYHIDHLSKSIEFRKGRLSM